MVNSIIPKEIMGHNRITVNVFYSQGRRTRKNIIHRYQVISACNGIFIPGKCIVDHINPFKKTCSPIIFAALGVIHQPNTNPRIILDQVMFDVDDSVAGIWVTNQLNAILPIADDLIVADRNIDCRAKNFL